MSDTGRAYSCDGARVGVKSVSVGSAGVGSVLLGLCVSGLG